MGGDFWGMRGDLKLSVCRQNKEESRVCLQTYWTRLGQGLKNVRPQAFKRSGAAPQKWGIRGRNPGHTPSRPPARRTIKTAPSRQQGVDCVPQHAGQQQGQAPLRPSRVSSVGGRAGGTRWPHLLSRRQQLLLPAAPRLAQAAAQPRPAAAVTAAAWRVLGPWRPAAGIAAAAAAGRAAPLGVIGCRLCCRSLLVRCKLGKHLRRRARTGGRVSRQRLVWRKHSGTRHGRASSSMWQGGHRPAHARRPPCQASAGASHTAAPLACLELQAAHDKGGHHPGKEGQQECLHLEAGQHVACGMHERERQRQRQRQR